MIKQISDVENVLGFLIQFTQIAKSYINKEFLAISLFVLQKPTFVWLCNSVPSKLNYIDPYMNLRQVAAS